MGTRDSKSIFNTQTSIKQALLTFISVNRSLYFRSLSSKHVFKLKAPDHSVARFIKHSPSHVSQLQTALSHLATVRIWISAEKGDNDDKIIEYQCRPIDVSLYMNFSIFNEIFVLD